MPEISDSPSRDTLWLLINVGFIRLNKALWISAPKAAGRSTRTPNVLARRVFAFIAAPAVRNVNVAVSPKRENSFSKQNARNSEHFVLSKAGAPVRRVVEASLYRSYHYRNRSRTRQIRPLRAGIHILRSREIGDCSGGVSSKIKHSDSLIDRLGEIQILINSDNYVLGII